MAQPALPRAPQFPNLPPTLKPIQHFLKAATEYDQRDPLVGYWSTYELSHGLPRSGVFRALFSLLRNHFEI
jgi:hypothetical protein